MTSTLNKFLSLIALGLGTALSLSACNMPNQSGGSDSEVYNRVDLQANAVQRVDNDEIEALLFIEKTASNAKSLTQQINPIIKMALEKAETYPDVKLTTASQTTNPNYNYKTNTITSWSMRSELRLISNNFGAASELIGVLQDSGLQVASINFKVSDAQRQKVENELITQVTDNFKQRAEVAKEAWGANEYRLVKLSISSNTNTPPTYYGNAAYTASEVALTEASAPMEAGEQRIEMTAQGAVEFVN